MDVFFYEAFEEEADELRRELPADFVAGYHKGTIQEVGHTAPPAPIISVRTQSVLPLDWAPNLKAILSRSTGYDHLTAYAEQAGALPALGYLPLYCHRAVAEHVLMLWLSLLRRLPLQLRQFKTFHRDGLTGGECGGRTLVVVGVGNVGYQVCDIGKALNMRVLGVDIVKKHADIDYVDIDAGLAQADVLVCAMNLTKRNRGYFDADKLGRAKPGMIFINCARGELSPSPALLAALKSGRLGGVGLDVYNQESLLAGALRGGKPSTDPDVLATLELAQRPDCICTPHNAFNSAEGVGRKSAHSVRQLVALRESGQFLWSPPAEE